VEVRPREWRTLALWEAWRQVGGSPCSGAVEDQEAFLIEAFGILDGEIGLLQAYHQAQAERRASSRSGRHG